LWVTFGGRSECNNAPEWEVALREIKVIAKRLVEQDKANKDKAGSSSEDGKARAARQFGR